MATEPKQTHQAGFCSESTDDINVSRGKNAFCLVPQRPECLFILHLILFSEHLLQVEEQKYSWGPLLRGHRGSWSWIRGKLPALGGSRSTPRQPGVVTDDTEGAELNPILYLPAARTAAVFRGRSLLNPVSWREKPADLSSLPGEEWSQSLLFVLIFVSQVHPRTKAEKMLDRTRTTNHQCYHS